MSEISIYCCTIENCKILEKLPSYITPVGLGNKTFPKYWEIEKNGENISKLNSYYAELTMYYWMWKNKFKKYEKNDFIGTCKHDLLWLDKLYTKKQKVVFSNLYQNLLSVNNEAFKNKDIIVPQEIIYTNKTLFEDFKICHGENLMNEAIKFLPIEERKPFEKHLKQNSLYMGLMFITKKKYFEEYCELIFPWVDKCYNYCLQMNLLNGYNIRLPVFLAERFSSYWMSKFSNKKKLSFARLGKFHISNKLNYFLNTTKLPLTFYQYPTLYKY
tara:strand:+ start:566 stop:1381 length:816 start_codon:yes stop_codon:yes gene_type:complete